MSLDIAFKLTKLVESSHTCRANQLARSRSSGQKQEGPLFPVGLSCSFSQIRLSLWLGPYAALWDVRTYVSDPEL